MVCSLLRQKIFTTKFFLVNIATTNFSQTTVLFTITVQTSTSKGFNIQSVWFATFLRELRINSGLLHS